MLAPAARAATRTGKFGPFTKDKIAIGAGGRLEDETARSIASQRFDDVREVVFDLSFREACHASQLMG